MINQADINTNYSRMEAIQANLSKIEDGTRKNYFSLLPSPERIKESIPNSFIIINPMNTVGGDGYWFAENESGILLAAFDCMGHGHIASMMARHYIKLLRKVIDERGIFFPNQVLIELHSAVAEKFNKNKKTHLGTGADFGVVRINKKIHEMEYAGAKMNLWEVVDGNLNIIKADRMQVGEFFDHEHTYVTQIIDLKKRKDSKFYFFSDGVTDLIGGPENKKFGSARLKELLESNYSYSMEHQKLRMTSTLAKWQGSNIALDDVMLIGFSY
ncbi:MAG: PP2C family protein-serine/threonine phosphatase [Bacteroidota bacterium]